MEDSDVRCIEVVGYGMSFRDLSANFFESPTARDTRRMEKRFLGHKKCRMDTTPYQEGKIQNARVILPLTKGGCARTCQSIRGFHSCLSRLKPTKEVGWPSHLLTP